MKTVLTDLDETLSAPFNLNKYGNNIEVRGGCLRMADNFAGQPQGLLVATDMNGIIISNLEAEGYHNLYEHHENGYSFNTSGIQLERCSNVEIYDVRLDYCTGSGLYLLDVAGLMVDGLTSSHSYRGIFCDWSRSPVPSADWTLRRMLFGDTRGAGPVDGYPPPPVISNRGKSILHANRWVGSGPLILGGIAGLVIDNVRHTGEVGAHTLKLCHCSGVRINDFRGSGIQFAGDDNELPGHTGVKQMSDCVVEDFLLDPDLGHQGRTRLGQLSPIDASDAFANPARIVNGVTFAPRPCFLDSNPDIENFRYGTVQTTGSGMIFDSVHFYDRHQGDPEPIWVMASAGTRVTVIDSCTFERLLVSSTVP